MRKLLVIGLMALALFLGLTFNGNSVTASPSSLTNSGFETGDFTGWSTGTVTDYAGVTGTDNFEVFAETYTGTFHVSPYSGIYMARLGSPRYEGQPIGDNTIYQEFTAVTPTLTFAYNICTYDYEPYNHFHYLVKDLTTPSDIVYYEQTAWGVPPADFKTTGKASGHD